MNTDDSLVDLLKKLRPIPGAPQRLTVCRDSIFEDSIAFFKQRKFDFTVPIKITFAGEPAIDGGGPVREFLPFLRENCYRHHQVSACLKEETHAFSRFTTQMLCDLICLKLPDELWLLQYVMVDQVFLYSPGQSIHIFRTQILMI